MAPRFAEIEKENPWLKTEYFEAEDRPDLIKKYQIEHIPSFVFLDKNGEVLKILRGVVDKKKVILIIKELKYR